MNKELLEILKQIERIVPKQITYWGSCLVEEVFVSQGLRGKEVIVLDKGGPGETPLAIVPPGKYLPGERVAIIQERLMGPFEALGLARKDSFGFNQFWLCPWSDYSAGKGINLDGLDRLSDPEGILEK